MKEIVAIGALLLTLASCVTQKKCFQKFPPQIITKDSIVLKDTTIYVPVKYKVPGDSIFTIDTIPCPDVKYHKETISPSGKTRIKVTIDKSVLRVDCKVDSLNGVIDSLGVKIKALEKYNSTVQIVEKPVTKKVTPVWAWVLLGGIILYFVGPPIVKTVMKV